MQMRNKHLRINPIHVINVAINAVGPAQFVLCMLVEDVSLPAPTYKMGISYFLLLDQPGSQEQQIDLAN